ncbi:MAG: tetratricopeptide repeat protein [Candidatus Thorarchaeota archaeon]
MMLESEMESALNYVNFVARFFDRVLAGDCDEVAVFLACILGQNIAGYGNFEAMARKYPNNVLARPYFLQSTIHRGDDIPITTMIESIQEALSLKPHPWIELELRMLLLATAMQIPNETHLMQTSSSRVANLFEEYEELDCFKPNFYAWFDRSVESFQENIDLAQKFDDQLALSSVYGIGAWAFRDSDVRKARECNEKSSKLTEINGGNPRNEAALNGQAAIHNVCGEFDASIECYLEIVEMKQKGHSFQTLRYIPLNLARVHHTAGNYEEALEWARLGIDDPHFISSWGMPKMDMHLRMALALASMKQFDEAEEHLNIAKKLTLDSTSEWDIAEGKYVLGIIEFNKGNMENAIDCLEEAYRLFGSYESRVHMNYILRHLAECEVAQFPLDLLEGGPAGWLQLLEETARESQYPGYLGISLVFKAELRAKQGQIEEARKCLSEAIEISKRPETGFLQNMIAALLNKPELSSTFDS